MTRTEAKLDQFVLDLETISDTMEKALGVYEYPFASGAAVDDMGLNARVIRFRCYWLNERYDEHHRFLEHVSGNQMHELRHPHYGLIRGRIRSVGLRHDDRLETAEMDVEFIEQLHGDELVGYESAVVPETEQALRAGQNRLMDTFRDAVKGAIGAAEGATVLNQALTEGQSALSQLGALSRVGRAYISEVDSAVSDLEGMASSVSNPTDSILRTINYGSSLPGRVVGTIARTVERNAQYVVGVSESPGQFAGAMASAVADLRETVPLFGTLIAGAGALHGAMVLGRLYHEDEQARGEAVTAESQPAFDAAGNLVRTRTPPTLASVDELERSLSTMRAAIQDAIDLDRTNDALFASALALLRHVDGVKLDRERIVTVSVPEATPLHVICAQNGLPASAAPRVLALNPQIDNPSFVHGEIQIHGR